MPKAKTHRGAAKRFKKTATGRYKHRRANRNHILTKKAAKRKQELRPIALINPSDEREIRRLLQGS